MTASIASVANQTTHTAANTIHLTLDIRLGGAAGGTIVATGLTNPDIVPGTPWRVAGGTVQTTLSTAGDVTYRPDRFISGGGVWGCGVRGGAGVAPVAATTHVS